MSFPPQFNLFLCKLNLIFIYPRNSSVDFGLKLIMAQIKRYLPSLLRHYLKDTKQAALDTELLRDVTFSRVDAVQAYLILSESQNTKISRIVQKVDKYIEQSEKQLVQSKQIEISSGQSLALLVSRLLMFMRLNIHNHQLISNISQYLLTTDQLYYSEIMLLLRMLKFKDSAVIFNHKKLVGHTKDCIQEHIQKTKAENLPYKYLTLLAQMSNQQKSVVLRRLTFNLAKKHQNTLELYDSHLLAQVLAVKSPKPITFLMRLGLRQNQLTKKRLIYEIILERMGKQDYQKYIIPGSACRDEMQSQIKYQFFNVLAQKQQFIDFGSLGQQIGIFKSNQFLESTLFIDNLFSFIERDQFNLDQPKINEIIFKLTKIFSNHVQNIEDQYRIAEKQGVLLKLMIILGYLKGQCVGKQQAKIKNLSQLISNFVLLIQGQQNQIFKDREAIKLTTLINFLLFQCLAHIKRQQHQQAAQRPLVKMDIIGGLVKQLKNKKGEDKRNVLFLKQFYEYTSSRLKQHDERKKSRFTQILSYDIVSDSDFLHFVELSREKLEKITQEIINSRSKIFEKYLFVKNVQIQPIIHSAFCFMDKQTKLPLACFQSPQTNQNYYIYSEDYQKLTDESSDLNWPGIWKREFLKRVYNSYWLCSKDEMQLSYKICLFISQNLLQK